MKDAARGTGNQINNEELQKLYRLILTSIGEDPERQGLRGTPRRVADALEFLTSGYRQDIKQVLNSAIFESDTSELVVVKNIELYSMCEHHLLPFFGKCHVGYLPNGKVIGLSKVARIVDHFARRLQIQENLTKQIAETLQEVTDAHGVGVVIEARHLCMMMRGVQKQNSVMLTSAVLGELHDSPATRAEFFALIQR